MRAFTVYHCFVKKKTDKTEEKYVTRLNEAISRFDMVHREYENRVLYVDVL